MNTGDIIRLERTNEILCDVGQYVDELTDYEWHNNWESWSARMDIVNDELHELLDIIAELEERNKMRMSAKLYKHLASAPSPGHSEDMPAHEQAGYSGLSENAF